MTRPKIIIDESVSAAQFATFEKYAQQQYLDTSDCVYIKEVHPGIPDSQILRHYLDESTILVTTDRPFHNTVLVRGLRSYYLDQDAITDKPLPGIQPKPDIAPAKRDRILKASYEPAPVEIRPLLLPSSPKKLKKLRVKRRRIRNHFQGLNHLEEVAVTVSWLPMGTQTLIGIRIRIASNVGLKALDASASYLLETITPQQQGPVSICHALILLIQLMLHPVKTVLYYDAPQIDNPVTQIAAGESADRCQALFETLMECFEHLEFVPVIKGRYLEKLHRKLAQLARNDRANEIVSGKLPTTEGRGL